MTIETASRARASARDDADDARPIARGPVLRQFLVVLVGVLIGIAGVDRFIAWWDREQGADGGERGIIPDEQLVWTNRPHFERPEFETVLDRYGNRSPEIPDDAPLDEVRIAGFGASRLYGAGGAKQSVLWNYALEELLREQYPDHAVRVVNGGVMAYSTLQACRRAALLLDALEPDLVFVVASPGAQMMLDPSAARGQVRFGEDADDLLPADVARGWPRPLLPLVAAVHRGMSDHSAIYRRHRAKFRTEDADRPPAIQRWTVSRAPNEPVVQAMLDSTLDEVEALAELCRRRGVVLRFLVLPEHDMDSDASWTAYLRDHQQAGAPPVGTPRDEPAAELERLLRERGVQTWNFFPEVSHIGLDRARHTMPDGAHWSRSGHEIVALGILRRLVNEHLVEELAARRAARPRTRPYGPSPFHEADA